METERRERECNENCIPFLVLKSENISRKILTKKMRSCDKNFGKPQYTKEIHNNLLQEMSEVQNGQRFYSKAQINCLEQLLTRSKYLENIENESTAYYVYGEGYEALVGVRKVSTAYQDIGISISLCLLLVGVFVQEKQEGMCFLNQTTQYRKRIYRTKIFIVILVSTIACVFWWLPECIFVFQNFYFSNPFTPVSSIPTLSDYPGWMTLWQVVAVVWIARVIRSVITGTLVAFASYKAKNFTMAWFLAALLVCGQWMFYII